MWGHVLYPRFGYEHNWLNDLVSIMDKTKGLKLSGMERLIVLRETYAIKSGIVSESEMNDPQKPLALVADSDRDGLRGLWGMETRIRQFKLYEIHKHYGYNLTEFLDLPRHIVEFILEEQRDEERKARIAREKAERANKASGEVPSLSSLGKGFDFKPNGW